LKNETTDHRLFRIRKEARRDVIDTIEMFFNSILEYISPNEFEAFTTIA